MANLIHTTFQLRRDTLTNWEKENPILKEGEPALCLDNNSIKIGDGKTDWKNLSELLLGAEQQFDALSKNAQSGIAVEQASEQARKKAVMEANKYTDGKIIPNIPSAEVTDWEFGKMYFVPSDTYAFQITNPETQEVSYSEHIINNGFAVLRRDYGDDLVVSNFNGTYSLEVAFNINYWYVDSESFINIKDIDFLASNNLIMHNDWGGFAAGEGATAPAATVALGYNAQSFTNNAIQLGTGRNDDENTLQFMQYPLVNADGTIPAERLVNAKGTTDYTDLTNKPKINGVELSGNQTTAQLGIKEGMPQETAQGMFANVIRNEAEGTVISVNDVSPFPQIVETKVERINKIPFPYSEIPSGAGSVVINGITWVVDDKGVITANGTATANSVFRVLKGNALNIPLKVKFFSGCPKGGSYSTYKLTIEGIIDDLGDGRYINFDEYTANNGVSATIFEGQTVKDLVFKPQLEKGTVATPYTPYIPDLTQAKVGVVGQNILPFPYFESSTSKYGATITVNSDGTVLIDSKGQPVTNDVYFELTPISESPYNDILFNAGYAGYLTGCPKGGSKETYSIVQTYSGAADTGEGITISLPETYWRFYIRVKKGVICNNLLFKPQITIRKISLDGVALPYEPYKSFEYIPTEDGTVDGVQSVSPNMTAFGEGLYVNMKYNADTNKVVENLQSQIEELKKLVATAQTLEIKPQENSEDEKTSVVFS